MNRNLVSRLKTISSLDPYHIRRLVSAAVTVVPHSHGDLKPNTKPMFLIERFDQETRNYTILSADYNKSSCNWKDHHHSIPNPFSGHIISDQRLIGSCNEWTLFMANGRDKERDSYQRRLSLWNPTTNHIQTLPLSFLPRPHPVFAIDIVCYGFGFDPKSQDYKVISFLEYIYEDCGDSFGQAHVEMYSLKTDTWKQITAPPDYPLHPVVHVNGVHYWDTLGPNFLSFDFVDESFSLIPHPKAMGDRNFDEDIDDTNYVVCDLVEFHGSLAALVHTNKNIQPFSFELWVWNGIWRCGSPKVTIGDDVLAGDKVSRVLGLFLNDYLFLQGVKEGELMLFNVKTSKLEKLGIHAGLKLSDKPSTLSLCPFFVPI